MDTPPLDQYTQTAIFAVLDAFNSRGLNEGSVVQGALSEPERSRAGRICAALRQREDQALFIQAVTLLGQYYQEMTTITFGANLPWRLYPTVKDGRDIAEIAFFGVPLAWVNSSPDSVGIFDVRVMHSSSPRLIGRDPTALDMDLPKYLHDHVPTFMKSTYLIGNAPPTDDDIREVYYPQQWAGPVAGIAPHILATTLEALLARFAWRLHDMMGYQNHGIFANLLDFVHPIRKQNVVYRLTHRALEPGREVGEGQFKCTAFKISDTSAACLGQSRIEIVLRAIPPAGAPPTTRVVP